MLLVGGHAMNKLSKSIMTITIIFGMAFLLATVGCSDSSGPSKAPQIDQGDLNLDDDGQNRDENNHQSDILQPIDSSNVRECTDAEFSQLIQWRNKLDKANQLIDSTGANESRWQKNQSAIDASISAVNMCDSRIVYHRNQPCKKTTKNIVTPHKPTIKVYDEFRLTRDCSKVKKYLQKFDENSLKPSEPIKPKLPMPAPLPNNGDNQGVDQTSNLVLCSNDEFSNLSEWSKKLDLSNKSILKMGNSISYWKYDTNALSFSTEATQSCESLMVYHQNRPCQKTIKKLDGISETREYTRKTITDRCAMSRTYFYEFKQNNSTLNMKNADLYLDLRNYSKNIFAPENFYELGNCVIENRSPQVIDYSNQKALVIDSRGFEDKMMVLETKEGLVVQCYGLELDGPFSKNQVVRILKSKNTNIQLDYFLK